ncbi:hypothetical protein Riv7116_6824 [Rivularia sp. PCC 7116]|uniref:hypothetical protein n=1 Tax=Rivularia sp. PCC 7116 TaxID=373994 RepID=UPI00029ECE64|nr:hypothetical protein [Rivularia sp. PCC 7116]AFY59140.1 hypothetical protein Riv7116_6824 [Rivularia sp. PCC 7116]
MFKKSFGFGLLAAGLMVAPGAAFADVQTQNSSQHTVQHGTAIDGSVNAQSSETLNVQEQIQKTRERVKRGGHGRYGRYGRYGRPSYCGSKHNTQAQNSSQGSHQSGVAVDYSDNAQSNSSVSDQKQVASNSRACR